MILVSEFLGGHKRYQACIRYFVACRATHGKTARVKHGLMYSSEGACGSMESGLIGVQKGSLTPPMMPLEATQGLEPQQLQPCGWSTQIKGNSIGTVHICHYAQTAETTQRRLAASQPRSLNLWTHLDLTSIVSASEKECAPSNKVECIITHCKRPEPPQEMIPGFWTERSARLSLGARMMGGMRGAVAASPVAPFLQGLGKTFFKASVTTAPAMHSQS